MRHSRFHVNGTKHHWLPIVLSKENCHFNFFFVLDWVMKEIHSGAFLYLFLFCVHIVLQRKRSEALILSGGSWGSVPFET